jgi:hypothetical protein
MNIYLPFSDDIGPYYTDFCDDGMIPFVIVVGFGNILKFADHHHFFEAAEAAIAEFQQIYVNEIEPIELAINTEITSNLNTWFNHPYGLDMTYDVVNISCPDDITATIVDSTLILNANSIISFPYVTVKATDGELEKEFTFRVKITDPNVQSTQHLVELENSPTQQAYPNNGTPFENTLTDLNWTTINQDTEGRIDSLVIDCMWRTLENPEEGSFWVKSPSGLEFQVYAPVEDGYENLHLNAEEFYGEVANGEWSFFIKDSDANGGHQVLNCEVSFYIVETSSQDNDDNVVSNSNSIQCYPNPFVINSNRNGQTTINFSTNNSKEHVEVAVYNAKGQKIRTLISENLSAGSHSVNWDGKNSTNKYVSSGIYFSVVKSTSGIKSTKILVMK